MMERKIDPNRVPLLAKAMGYTKETESSYCHILQIKLKVSILYLRNSNYGLGYG